MKRAFRVLILTFSLSPCLAHATHDSGEIAYALGVDQPGERALVLVLDMGSQARCEVYRQGKVVERVPLKRCLARRRDFAHFGRVKRFLDPFVVLKRKRPKHLDSIDYRIGPKGNHLWVLQIVEPGMISVWKYQIWQLTSKDSDEAAYRPCAVVRPGRNDPFSENEIVARHFRLPETHFAAPKRLLYRTLPKQTVVLPRAPTIVERRVDQILFHGNAEALAQSSAKKIRKILSEKMRKDPKARYELKLRRYDEGECALTFVYGYLPGVYH